MNSTKIQEKINVTFEKHFGYTSLNERLSDIQNECNELLRWTDMKNLKEEAGHLLSSLIQLCNENNWLIDNLINETIQTIECREEQYLSMGRKINVAILGGKFDPIHKGHIQLAQFILKASKNIDEVWLKPDYIPMGKDSDKMVNWQHRLNMCRLAASVDGRIKVWDYDIINEIKGDTFYFFKRLMNEKIINGRRADSYRFSFILGIDNANTFDTWVNFEELEKMAKFIVVKRKGVERNYNVDWYLQKPHIFLNCETPIIDVSSSQIREMFATSTFDGIEQFLDENVLKYIFENKLYNGK
jgi:nicotinate-nucleotide adenylyltransferase